MDTVHKNKRIYRVQWTRLPLFHFRKDFVRDFADHFGGKFNPIKFLELVMNIPCTHSAGIERDYFLLNPGNIPLIFRDQLWFKLTIAVTGNIDLEFPVLAFECFGRVAIPLIIALKITFTIFFIAQSCIHLGFQKLLQYIFEAVFEKGVNISHTGNVVFCNNLSDLVFCYCHK